MKPINIHVPLQVAAVDRYGGPGRAREADGCAHEAVPRRVCTALCEAWPNCSNVVTQFFFPSLHESHFHSSPTRTHAISPPLHNRCRCPNVHTVDLRRCPRFREREHRVKMAKCVFRNCRKLKTLIFDEGLMTKVCVYAGQGVSVLDVARREGSKNVSLDPPSSDPPFLSQLGLGFRA